MTKNTLDRLVKSLHKTKEWASGRSLSTSSFDEYLEGRGRVGLAVSGLSGLFVLGMQEVKKASWLLEQDNGA